MASLRSSRRDAPRKKYTVDAFDSIQDLLLESGSSASGTDEDEPLDDEDQETDFDAGAEPSGADDDSMSGLDELGPLEEVDDRASNEGDLELDDSVSIADAADHERPRQQGRHKITKKVVAPDGEELFVRGVPEVEFRHMSKMRRRTLFFGPSNEDWNPIVSAMRKWGHEPCLPSRKDSNGRGGFAYGAKQQEEINNAHTNWSWYETDGGKDALRHRQSVRLVSSNEASEYLVSNETCERTLVIGPVGEQKLYKMKLRQHLVLAEPFRLSPEHPKSQKCNARNYKSGYIVNLGARVNCLDWAPNQPGFKQYLAASVLPKRDHQHTKAPAFSPQELCESSIQIWEFCSAAQNFIDKRIAPRLSLTLCTSAGEVKAIKWCPVPHNRPGTLGLLACIFSDGSLRVFDIDTPEEPEKATHLVIEKAALEVHPPNTVCTSIAWLSSSRIAVSCANGYIAVWDLSKASKTVQANPRPVIYASISTGYIVSISSCYPSLPNMVVATNMAGYITLTDLSKPNPGSAMGTVLSARTRIGSYQLVWHQQTQAAISTEENMTLRALAVRRWFVTTSIGRTQSHATAMAVSPCHPFLLLGCANGEVIGTNPTTKIVLGGRHQKTVQQTWFKHEWRRPTSEEKNAAAMGSEEQDVSAILGKDGLSRFVDGFKAVDIVLGTANGAGDRVMLAAIHEEKSAVTALAWNPNVHVGGWAAAGMGDGLLRVEDIAS